MNKNDIMLIKESMNEYCENIYGECLGYMKKNNVEYNLSGNDELSRLLKRINAIQKLIEDTENIDILFDYRNECFKISKSIRELIGA